MEGGGGGVNRSRAALRALNVDSIQIREVGVWSRLSGAGGPKPSVSENSVKTFF